MMSFPVRAARRMVLLSLAVAGLVATATAQTSAPPQPYTALLYNPDASHWVFRAQGAPWICVQDGRCSRLKFDRIPDADLPAAEIAPLGFADRVFYLAASHPKHLDGDTNVYRCTAEGCARFELDAGAFAFLGTYTVKQGDRTSGRTAILARPDNDRRRSRLLWCSESGCIEHPLTRENPYSFLLLGSAQTDGRQRFWLREASGLVFACAQPAEAAEALECARTDVVYSEFPGDAELDERALVTALEDALRRRSLADAERLLAEAQARFPGRPQWAAFAQRANALRTEQQAQLRAAQARRLVAEARKEIAAGDFESAETLLREAAKLVPNLPEMATARAELQRLRAERERGLRERAEYINAIEGALAAYRLWEAERLIADAQKRFANDPAFRDYRARVTRMRAEAEWQRRIGRAREAVAAAREAIARGEFAEAERALGRAEDAAPGLPEIGAARADLTRERIAAEWRADEIRQIAAAIDAALARNRLDLAERLLADAAKRHPRHAGWAALKQRLDQAKRNDSREDRERAERERLAKARDLVARARREAAAGDFAGAEKLMKEAEALTPTLPELAAARTEIERLRRAAEDKVAAIRKHVADARAALAKKDLAAAERAVAEAEKLDKDNAAVKAVRADLERAKRDPRGDKEKENAQRVAKLVADARAALAKKDIAGAERLVADAEKLDKDAPAVKAVRADLDRAKRDAAGDGEKGKADRIAKLVADARAALAKKDLTAAERLVADAEKLDKDAPAVKAVRADLETAKKAGPAPKLDEAKLRANLYGAVMSLTGAQGERYRAAPGNKALAYCIDWSKATADKIPAGPFAALVGGNAPNPGARAVQDCNSRRGAAPCTCALVDADGRNVLRVPKPVLDRLTR